MDMVEGGYFPGVKEFTPDVQDALLLIQDELGITMRARCCMPEFSRAQTCGWRHRPVKASIKGTLKGLSDSVLKQTYKDALDAWNSVCNTGLEWTEDWTSANIYADCQRIDGASGTLAWSYLVQCGGATERIQLEQRYDNGETWTRDWFLEVAMHEIGHALGLEHDTTNKAALMYPYSHGGKILKPTQFEIARVIPLYGNPIVNPSPGLPVIIGGTLVMQDATVVGLEAGNSFSYAGKNYKVKVSQ